MPQAQTPPQAHTAPAPDLPADVLAALGGGEASCGVIYADGRIAEMTSRLLGDLGFSHADDLRGLPFASLWQHDERPAVTDALARALARETARLTLDLRYLQHRDATCEVTLARAACAPLIVATIDCAVCDASG